VPMGADRAAAGLSRDPLSSPWLSRNGMPSYWGGGPTHFVRRAQSRRGNRLALRRVSLTLVEALTVARSSDSSPGEPGC
jgi:hypothetical protein